MKRIDLTAVSIVQHFYWNCPECYNENIITNEQFKDDLGNYPYGQEITCEECGKTYTIDDVHY